MDNQSNLIEGLNTSQILVGLDLGTKTLGVAVSDRLKIIASPLLTIQRKGTKKDILKLQEILKEYEIGGFILGLPLSLDNSDNKQTQLVRNFNSEINNFFKLPSILWDERFSSQGAFNLSSNLDINTTKKIEKLDENSAQFILQGFLDYLAKNNT